MTSMYKNENKANAKEQETVKVPNYGDMKIDEAKGKRSPLCVMVVCRFVGAG